ncbi:MAG: SET domain-containing protein [Candidatus Aenigmarchaeota archaeon]|nr:SET domain-containing protein [Candidatus Aenigmarchaeota archaeon]
MLCVKASVRNSKIHGMGLFASENIEKGAIVAIFTEGVKITDEKGYLRMAKKKDKTFEQTSVRLAGDYFLYKDKIESEDFINHSDDPSLLYHCGVCFARRNIKTGEELTADYKHFLSADKSNSIRNAQSGKIINGFSWKDALRKSAKELTSLID